MNDLINIPNEAISTLIKLVNMIWNITEESINEACEFIRTQLENKFIDIKILLKTIDQASVYKPKLLRLYAQMADNLHEYNNFDLNCSFKFQSIYFKSYLIRKKYLTGWGEPIELIDYSLDEIMNHNRKDSFYYLIFNDDVKIMIEKLDNSAEKPTFSQLLERAALYGSTECFKYLYLNDAEITDNIMNCAVIGNSQEIIHLCEQKVPMKSSCISFANFAHNNKLVAYMIDKYSFGYDWDCCLKTNNIESFLYKFQKTENFSRNDINQIMAYIGESGIGCLMEYFLANADYKESLDKYDPHMIIYHGNYQTIEVLLKYGLNPNGLLKFCVSTNDVKIAELLVKYKADVNFGNENLLELCTYSKAMNLAKFLLENGYDVNAQKSSLLTTVMDFGLIDFFSLLLDYKYDTEIKDKNKRTVIHYAISKGQTDFVDILVNHKTNHCDIESKDNKGNTPLMAACAKGNIDMVRILIRAKCNINAVNSIGQSGVLVAMKSKCNDIVKLLIDNNCDINQKTKFDETLLSMAQKQNNAEILDILEKKQIH